MKKICSVFRQSGWTLAGFEIVYKFAAAALFAPLLYWGLDRVMEICGYCYLTRENIGAFLQHPVTVAFFLLVVMLGVIYALGDVGAVVFVLDQGRQGRRVQLLQVFSFTGKNLVRMCKGKGWLGAVLLLCLLPFLSLGVGADIAATISLPTFLQKAMLRNRLWILLGAGGLLGLTLVLMRWIFVFHYMTIEGCTMAMAAKKSAALTRRRKCRTFLLVGAAQTGGVLLYAMVVGIGIFLIQVAARGMEVFLKIPPVTAPGVWILLAVSYVAVCGLATPISFGTLSLLFYRWKLADREPIRSSRAPAYAPRRQRWIRRINGAVGCGIVLCAGVVIYGAATGWVNPPIESVKTMEITAHRGASGAYPENTMAAFAGAVELGADWIELDVQQSRDGEIFVMHDSSFLRTTGYQAKSWELTYAQIQTLDAGSYFDPAFAGERIPLLSEVIAFAKAYGVRLNIELKPTGHEREFEQTVVDLIRGAEYETQCVVSSQVYGVLGRVKSYAPEIETVYVMSFAYGDISQLTAADHFSVQAGSVTRRLVSAVHNSGKQLLAWTVNTQSGIDRLIQLHVDNIVTDDIPLAKTCIFDSKFSEVVDDYMELLE